MLAGIGGELRRARLDHDLSQVEAAMAAMISRSTWGRVERGEAAGIRIEDLTAALAVVGLDLSLRAFPSGQPIRDIAHVRLLARLHECLGQGVSWRTEVPFPRPGDMRAWDALLGIGSVRIGVEAETRARDAQALERRLALKARDGRVDHLILLLADTRHNRGFVAATNEVYRADFPVPGDVALARLADGVDPEGSAIILL